MTDECGSGTCKSYPEADGVWQGLESLGRVLGVSWQIRRDSSDEAVPRVKLGQTYNG